MASLSIGGGDEAVAAPEVPPQEAAALSSTAAKQEKPPQELSEEEWILQGCPDDLIDPITLGLLEDPVSCTDGHVYSRHSIRAHIDHCASKGLELRSPMTGEAMEPAYMPVFLIKRMVADYVEGKRKQWQEQQQQQEG